MTSSRGSCHPGIEPAFLTSPALAGVFFTTRDTWTSRKLIAESPKKVFGIAPCWSYFFRLSALLLLLSCVSHVRLCVTP